MQTSQNIGAHVVLRSGINPVSSTAATVNGIGQDRMTQGGEQGFESAKLIVAAGAVSGTPDATSIAYTVQDSADNSSWAAVSTDVAAAGTTITAASTATELNVNLVHARRYVRVVAVVSFTGGSSPAALISATWCFGGAKKLPVSSLTT